VTFFEAEAELLAFCSTPSKTKLKPNHSNPHTKHHERFAPKNKMPPPQPKPSLVESFEKLQLDPRFHGHQAEFDVVCWQHIHQHLPADPPNVVLKPGLSSDMERGAAGRRSGCRVAPSSLASGSSTTPLANRRPPTRDPTNQSHSTNLHHPKALTGQYSTSLRLTMTTPLTTACRNLQLDPSDHSRMATFSAFCWQHILERKPPRWIVEARDGTIRLQH
jgi:hypothetical protein